MQEGIMLGLFLNPSGRIGRGMWWLVGPLQLVLIMLWLVSLFSAGNMHRGIIPVFGLFWTLLILPILWMGLCADIKRYHDRGKSGFWVLISFIPLIGPVWMIIELGMLPGDQDENRFGPPTGSSRRGGNSDFDDDGGAKLAKFDDDYFKNYAQEKANRVVTNQSSPVVRSKPVTSGPVFGKRT
jgi:uncharacterized membrane protein YhaH (DUF805 family)